MVEVKMTPLEAVAQVRDALETRRNASQEATQMRAAAKAVYEAELKKARDLQREGTRHFVRAIEQAREESDLPLRALLESVGMAYQSYSEIKRNIATWDGEVKKK